MSIYILRLMIPALQFTVLKINFLFFSLNLKTEPNINIKTSAEQRLKLLKYDTCLV